MSVLGQIAEQLQAGEDEQVAALTKQALDEGLEARRILDDGLIAGMNVVGEKFRRHEVFLPDVLLSAKAMYAGLDLLRPHLGEDGAHSRGKVVLGTVQGDLHDIGKNLVGIMLGGAGFEVIDLGKDVTPEQFVSEAREKKAQIIGMSALLTTTMPIMRQVIELLRTEGLADDVQTIIGGAPVSEEFACEIGANAYAYDAANAVDQVRRLILQAG